MPLEHLYDQDYFEGRSSGYGPQGYGRSTVDWPGWLEIIQHLQPDGLLCDLGCAFGFLVDQARKAGYRAVGCDISNFAIRQQPDLKPWLFQADLQALPLPDDSFDVVCVFDVLEHVPRGDQALAEAVRVLKPTGLLIGATPDPVFFDRQELTHCFERPPSYWVRQLAQLGLEAVFRFSGVAYNFQFVARYRTPAPERKLSVFQFDYVGEAPEFIQTDSTLTAVPRQGWSSLRDQVRFLQGEQSLVYLLNTLDNPRRARFSFQLSNPAKSFGTLRLSLDGVLLKEVVLSSEDPQLQVSVEALVARGGHNLTWDLRPVGLEVGVSHMQIDSSAATSEELCHSLPFDLFQRYQTTALLLQSVPPGRILDVGGLLGDASGHMACSSDFLQHAGEVTSSDLRPADLADHVQADALELPFESGEFETVVSLDVFEHIPPPQRERFLQELDRIAAQTILLGFPALNPEVEKAEHLLSRTLLEGHGFLKEHADFGLPPKDVVEVWAGKNNYSVQSFPSGYLPNWLVMQSLTRLFLQTGEAALLRRLNTLYNSTFFGSDQRSPCYRQIFVVMKTSASPGFSTSPVSASEEKSRPADLAKDLLGDPEFLQLQKLLLERALERSQDLSAVQFLAGERQKEIGLLREEVEHLKKELMEAPLLSIWKRRRRKD